MVKLVTIVAVEGLVYEEVVADKVEFGSTALVPVTYLVLYYITT